MAKRKRKARRHQVHVKLRPELIGTLRELAQARDVTVTLLIDVAVREWLTRQAEALEGWRLATVDERTPMRILSDASAERVIREKSMGARA